jgi:hypothetical protein
MTIVYASIYEFLHREDKAVNGVSAVFANGNPGFSKDNESNESCWNCSGCSGCSGCADCADCSRCTCCADCSRCTDCTCCSGCADCSRCTDCADCYKAARDAGTLSIPKIENIHSKVLAAASQKGALDMSDWHTCETTHCRAGWVTRLAGSEGRELEDRTSTLFAAMQIYKHSSTIRVPSARFFDSHAAAMKDMQRCAEEEVRSGNNHAV